MIAILTLLALPLLAQPGEERFQPPPGIQWNYFRNAGGARIRYSRVPAGGGPAKATIVLMHGYTEFAEKYFETMRDFHARGYDVYCSRWLDSAFAFIDRLR